MYKTILSLTFSFLVFCVTAFATIPTPAHIVIVLEENHDYSQIVGSSAAPFINSLASDSDAALFTQSFALTHPSQPNYLMFFSGSNQGVTDDGLPSGLPFTTANLGASLLASGKSFYGYSEGLPSVGYNGTSSGAYARKHNPWANWQNSTTNGIPSTRNVPLTSFPTSYDSLPTLSFVIPNQDNDMHNGTDPSTITTGDTWLHNHLNGYIQWAKTHNSLFILTFDEGVETGSNHIATIFLGPMVQHGQYSESINHYRMLRTLEDMYSLPYAGASSSASPISDCWKNTSGVTNDHSSSPKMMSLEQNYPNPFNPKTIIRYTLSANSVVTLKVYNVLWQEVATLLHRAGMESGDGAVTFDASQLTSGVYFYRIEAQSIETSTVMTETKKMVLVK